MLLRVNKRYYFFVAADSFRESQLQIEPLTAIMRKEKEKKLLRYQSLRYQDVKNKFLFILSFFADFSPGRNY